MKQRIARLPALQPMMERFQQFLAEQEWTVHHFAAEVYGRTPLGGARSPMQVYPIADGQRAPTVKTAQLWFEKTGLDLREFAKAPDLVANEPMLPATRAARAVAAFNAEQESKAMTVVPLPQAPPLERSVPKLALSIGADGRGNLTFNLIDAPAGEVLRALAVLQASGLADLPPTADEPAPPRMAKAPSR